MTNTVNYYFHHPAQPDPRLGQIVALLQELKQNGERLMATLADLTTAVATEKTVEEGAIALIQGLAKAVNDAQGSSDPHAMDILLAQINEQSAALASAVSAVPAPTPVDPTPVPAPNQSGPEQPGPDPKAADQPAPEALARPPARPAKSSPR
jgi:hypothetical protein